MSEVKEKELSDEFEVSYSDNEGNKTKKIKMTLGLLNVLFSKFKDQDQIYSLGMDSIMQNDLVNEVMDDRDSNGNRSNPEKNWSLYLDRKEGEKLTNWISEHIIDFFTSKLELQARTIQTITDLVQKVQEKEQTKIEK